MRFRVYNILIILMCAMADISAIDKPSFKGKMEQSYFKLAESNNDPFFQNETSLQVNHFYYDFYLRYKYQANDLPTAFYPVVYQSDMLTGDFTLKYKQFRSKFGYFYDSLGHGILFKSFKDPLVFTDTNLYGYALYQESDYLSAKYFTGNMRDKTSLRSANVKAAELVFFPSSFSFGGSFLEYQLSENNDVDRLYSLLFSTYLDWLDLDIELARNHDNEHSYASYVSAVSQLKHVTQVYNYTKYHSFLFRDSYNRLSLNQGPLGVYTHTFTLLSRLLPNLDMNNQESFRYGISYQVSDSWMLSSVYSRHVTPFLYYDDFLIESSLQNYWVFSSQSVLYSSQTAGSRYYWNLVQASQIPINTRFSLDWDTEFQKQKYVDYSSMIHRLSFNITKRYSIGFNLETKSVNNSDTSWFAWILTMKTKQDTIQAYIGSQAAGKVCSGGVCIYQPEFDGIRINWQHSF